VFRRSSDPALSRRDGKPHIKCEGATTRQVLTAGNVQCFMDRHIAGCAQVNFEIGRCRPFVDIRNRNTISPE